MPQKANFPSTTSQQQQQQTRQNFQANLAKRSGGHDILIRGTNPLAAYAQLRTWLKDAKVRELERRFIWNIKPKIMRQMNVERLEKYRSAKDFREKFAIANEIIRAEKDREEQKQLQKINK